MKITKTQLKQIIKEEISKVLNEAWPSVPVGDSMSRGMPRQPTHTGTMGPPSKSTGDKEDPVEIMNKLYVGKDKAALQQALELYKKRVMTQKHGTPGYDPIALKMYHLLEDYINKGTFKGMKK